MKILVVDNDTVTLAVISKKLKDIGYKVFVIDNAIESFRIISEEKIDLVISDIMMPCLSGFTLITMLKRFYFSSIPVILMSSCDHESVLLDAHGINADSFFKKPLDFARLFKRMEELSPGKMQLI